MAKEIKLTKGYAAIVDDEDFEKVSKFKWRAAETKWGVYGVTWMRIKGKGAHRYLHRFLLDFPKQKVDHKNGNPLDNRRQNLRIATNSQNQCNRAIAANNSSGFKGVSFNKAAQKFKAYIKINNKLLYLGLHQTAEEAAHVYNEHAKKLHGEFARLNKI